LPYLLQGIDADGTQTDFAGRESIEIALHVRGEVAAATAVGRQPYAPRQVAYWTIDLACGDARDVIAAARGANDMGDGFFSSSRGRGLVCCTALVAALAALVELPSSAIGLLAQTRDPGRVVEDRRAHARQFRGREPSLIPRLLASRTGNLVLPDPEPPRIPTTVNARSTASAELAELVCYSKAMLVGRFLGGTSRLTDDESWLFSEWTFAVERLYKGLPDHVGATLDVVISGGRLDVAGRTVTALNNRFPLLPDIGQRYLLFLRVQDETGAYVVGSGVRLKPSAPAALPPTPNRGMRTLDEAALMSLTESLVATMVRGGDPNCGFVR
jgi:hypothetical protein